MFADQPEFSPSGTIGDGVLPQGRSREAIFEFIRDQLPRWRDRPERPKQSAETRLTSQLCAHLNSAARMTPGWDCFQFRVEEGDETQLSRSIDLVTAAAGEVVVVQGRSYFDFETILPVECKRLPTPISNGRDEREYVATRNGTGGGIQRFKQGLHAASHSEAAMIGYVQEGNLQEWLVRVQQWIQDMHKSGAPGWSAADALVARTYDPAQRIATHQSVHSRSSMTDLRLRHVWIEM